ncbi:hypothetical protein KKD61_01750 [Patescibacteria group bacterium]|nr:hypothetical protein [Patescibacteria group bacterium]
MILILFLALLFLVCPSDVRARETQFLKISPAIVNLVLEEPDQEEVVTIELNNTGDQTIRVELFAIDFKQQDLTNVIEFLPLGDDSYSYSLASFISLETNHLILTAKEKREFNVAVKNREDLSPGGHYAAIVARLIDEQQQEDVTRVSPAISCLILLRKTGGEIFNLQLKKLTWPIGSIVFRYPELIKLLFQNEGNIHLIPYGSLTINDFLGRTIYGASINTSSSPILPQSRKYIEANLKKIGFSLPISINSISINGRDSLNEIKFDYKKTFVYLNPLFAIGVIVIGSVLAIKIKKRGR